MKLVITLIIFLFSKTAWSQGTEPLDLYLLIGQSNMAGRGPITDSFKTQGNPRLLMFNKDLQWVPAANPLHFDKPSVAGVGPGMRFGLELLNYTNHRIGLIPCAVGGTSIKVWVPGAIDKATGTHPYDDMMVRLKAALQTGTLKGVIWLQGESDSGSPEGYIEKLEKLICSVRCAAENDALPFVVGELAHFKPQYENINKQLPQLEKDVKHLAIVHSDGFKDKGDNTHLDAVSADIYGKRFALAMHQLNLNL